MAEKKKAPEKKEKKTEKKVEKKKVKEGAKAGKKPVKKGEETISITDLAGFIEEPTRYFTCEKCGMVISVVEECGCEACNLKCCGKPMDEVFSLVGNTYHCEKCGLKVMIEGDCSCSDPCDLICCGHKMSLCYDI